MKAILEFDLPEDQEEFNDAAAAGKYVDCLQSIAQEVFRPARKHGYQGNERLNQLIQQDDVAEAIEILEELFYTILRDRSVTLY